VLVKTTAAAKLALKLKGEGRNPLLVPADLQRPAAVKQLKILAEQAQVDFLNIISDDAKSYKISSAIELSKIVKSIDQQSSADWIATSPSAPRNDAPHDVYIIDTAGRLQIDTDLMAELLILEKQLEPSEKLLVIDSLIGQEAANVADTFNTQIGITGIILTKLDSDTRGGAALSVVEATGKAIKLASVGEKLEDLENFYPERMASRILGMGDVISLVEKTQQKISEEESKRLEEELMKGNFNYETFLSFQNMISKIGNFGSIFKMLGMGQFLSGMGLDPNNQDALLEQGQNKLSRYKIAINSMTKQERSNPELLATHSSANSRKKRIAKGSGLKDSDIAQLSSEFSKMSKVFKSMGPMMSMMKASQGAEEAAGKFNPQQAMFNPKQMLEQMSSGLSKKQRQALNQINPGLTNSAKKTPQIKKGEKPQVKGFRD
jgi:signal recognition particle subunit SRP54